MKGWRAGCAVARCSSHGGDVLLFLDLPERTVMEIMGWSTTGMAARYQHVTDPIRHEVAARVGGLLGSIRNRNETRTETAGRSALSHRFGRGAFGLVRAEVAGFEPARGLCPQPA